MTEREERKRCDTPEDGSLSLPSIGSTKNITIQNEDKPVSEKQMNTKDTKAIVSETSSPTSTKNSTGHHLDNSKNLKVVESSDQKEPLGLKVESTTLSESTSDTHESKQTVTDECKYSIVQNLESLSEKEQPILESGKDPKESELKSSNATFHEQTTIEEKGRQSVAQVSSDGDGKGIVGASPLIRSNECLEDSEDGPVAKRQRLCPVDQKSGNELNDKKELSGTSETKLQ